LMDSVASFNELLRVPLEVIEATASNENAHETAAGELGLVLEVGQQVGQFDVGLLNRDWSGDDGLLRGDAASSDSEVGFANLHPGFGDRRTVAESFGALRHQRVVIELHAVSGLVLDAVPERLEFFTVEHRLTGPDRPALVGVLDVQFPGQLTEHFFHLRELALELFWQLEGAVLERLPQGVLHPALCIDVARILEVRPDGFRLGHAKGCGPPCFVRHRDGGKLVLFHDAKANAGVGLDLRLEVRGELLIAFRGDDSERIDIKAA